MKDYPFKNPRSRALFDAKINWQKDICNDKSLIFIINNTYMIKSGNHK